MAHECAHMRSTACFQAERSVESLFTELASCGLVAAARAGAALADHVGGCHLAAGALARASPAGDPDPSAQQLRAALAEFCALPLLCPAVAARSGRTGPACVPGMQHAALGCACLNADAENRLHGSSASIRACAHSVELCVLACCLHDS